MVQPPNLEEAKRLLPGVQSRLDCFGKFGLATGYASKGRTVKEAMVALGVAICEVCPTKHRCLTKMKQDTGTEFVMSYVRENIQTGYMLRQTDDINRTGVFHV